MRCPRTRSLETQQCFEGTRCPATQGVKISNSEAQKCVGKSRCPGTPSVKISNLKARYESESSGVQGRIASTFQIQRFRKKMKANQPPGSQRRTTEGSPSRRASAGQPLASQPKPASLSKLIQEVKRFHILRNDPPPLHNISHFEK